MTYRNFVERYAADVKRNPDEMLAESPLSFPLSSNQRGEKLVDFLQRTIDLDLRGKRVLDVGCAYGGLSIALANAGADVDAVDISAKFIEYATANSEGLADIRPAVADASSVTMRKLYGKGSFDLIVINDVLEHIYDTTSLAANLDYLLSETGVVYFKVPNGFSPRFALSEGHRKIFGLTLIDPDCWFHLHPKRASIFYRPLEHFMAIFSHFNMPEMLLVDEEQVFRRFSPKKLKKQIGEIFAKAREFDYPNSSIKQYIRDGILRFRDGYEYDLETHGAEYVTFKYGSYFYTGFMGRPGASLTALNGAQTVPGIGQIALRERLAEAA
jgi:2-polyprenyl-3-methyl-5-hydroxy-6-metoxy-1,4-benzoquinol methylase